MRNKVISLKLDEQPDRMFINTTTTGGHAWAPSSGVLPSDLPEASKVDDFLQESSGDLDDLIAIE